MGIITCIEAVRVDFDINDPEGKSTPGQATLTKDVNSNIIAFEIKMFNKNSALKLEDLAENFSIFNGERGVAKLQGMLWFLAGLQLGPYPEDGSREEKVKYCERIKELVAAAREEFQNGAYLAEKVDEVTQDEARRIRRAEAMANGG